MTTEYKVILRDIVELFYQSPFKIFNINSLDGKTMVKPFGYFISLGITTSLESLKLIRDYISKSDYGFTAKLVEIKSIKSEEYGDFLNVLLTTPEDEIKKYESDSPTDHQKVLEEEETKNLMSEIQEEVSKGDFHNTILLRKLTELEQKINGEWDKYSVLMTETEPVVFHKYVNYKKETDAEYRIGIYATKD